MTTAMKSADAPEGVIPDWELCDRMRRSMRLVSSTMDNLTWLVEGVTEESLYAMRDLNPQPADSERLRSVLRLIHSPRDPRPVTVKPRLTLVRSVA